MIERQQLIRTEITDLKISKGIDDAKCAGLDSGSQPLGDRARIGRAQWVPPVGVAWHDGFGVRAEFRETGKKGRRQKRHVARDHHHLIRWRLDERRIETAQRARSRNAIRDYRHPGSLSLRWLATDNQDMRGNRAKHGELPAENRRWTDRQRAFIASAKTPSAAAGQDCC